MDRKERLIGRERHNRDVDEVCLVRDRKPIDPDAALVERLRHREEASWLYRITLNSAYQKLRGRRREGNATFVLHDLEGLSHPAIAEVLQLKLGAVKSRAQRARGCLRKRLATYMSDPAEECLRRLPC